MQSVQESKQELEESIRYAENAISSAKQTIESMEFRQEMAKKQHSEHTGREEALNKLVKELEGANEKLANDNYNFEREVAQLKSLLAAEERESAQLHKEVEFYTQKYSELAQGMGVPTMPVIPKDVAIAIFREGMQSGINEAVADLEGQTITVSESGYTGDFEVSFERSVILDDELDFDWMRDKVGQYNEEFVVGALKGLCALKEFECRIHGIDDQEEKKND